MSSRDTEMQTNIDLDDLIGTPTTYRLGFKLKDSLGSQRQHMDNAKILALEERMLSFQRQVEQRATEDIERQVSSI